VPRGGTRWQWRCVSLATLAIMLALFEIRGPRGSECTSMTRRGGLPVSDGGSTSPPNNAEFRVYGGTPIYD
jgi:hypothetical protein